MLRLLNNNVHQLFPSDVREIIIKFFCGGSNLPIDLGIGGAKFRFSLNSLHKSFFIGIFKELACISFYMDYLVLNFEFDLGILCLSLAITFKKFS